MNCSAKYIEEPVAHKIADDLREAIICGELKGGSRVTEASVAERYSVSRTPVREAFRQLEAEGLLCTKPNKGAVVSSISEEDIKDYYEVFGLLASHAAEKAALRISAPNLERMEKLVSELKEHCDVRRISSMVECHNRLTEVFAVLCGNSRLIEELNSMMRPFQRFRVMLSETNFQIEGISFYEQLIAAFREHDPQKAAFLAAKYSGEMAVEVVRAIQARTICPSKGSLP